MSELLQCSLGHDAPCLNRQQQVAADYEQLAAADADRIIRIDGARTPDAVSADVQRTIAERLGLVLR